MKVLLIDSDKFVSTVFESEFRQQNISVEIAVDGKIGIEQALAIKPDLIILELVVPKKNGFQVIKEIRKNQSMANIPIIVCSILSQKPDIDEALKLGANKYYPKADYSIKQIVKKILDTLMEAI